MSALDISDRQLLDFLCAVEASPHCRVASIKTRHRPSLKRLRFAGLVWFDGFTPSASAMADWQRRHGSPDAPTSGEKQPPPQAADADGGAAARTSAAPPKLRGDSETFPCGHPRTEENSQRVGVGNGVRCRECRREIAKRSKRKRDTQGASGTARKAPSATVSAVATSATGDAPIFLRPFDPKPKTAAPEPIYGFASVDRRGSAMRKSLRERAMLRIEKGLPANLDAGAQLKCVQQGLQDELREQARLADPIEQAKLKLQRRYSPVCSMAMFGGRDDLFMVGRRKDVTRDELLRMAEAA